jgi:hypothetical protein
MSDWYLKLDDFVIDEDIVQHLRHLDISKLPNLRTKFGPWFYLKKMLSKGRWWQSRRDYGWFCQNTSEMRSLSLAEDITERIRHRVKALVGEDLAQEAVIRLQLMYGGSIIPHHIDMTRQVSLVYPVMHDLPSVTEFYDSQYNNGLERDFVGVDPPNKPAVSFSIEHKPVLLNTNIVHAVRYAKNSYTKHNPRRSITIKWEHKDFSQITAAIYKYRSKE